MVILREYQKEGIRKISDAWNPENVLLGDKEINYCHKWLNQFGCSNGKKILTFDLPAVEAMHSV
jgi:hypothetical protein